MKNPVRLYEVTRDGLIKVGNFEGRDDALRTINTEYSHPMDTAFVYTVVDTESPVNSSMVMRFFL